jgi:hypothetical protein
VYLYLCVKKIKNKNIMVSSSWGLDFFKYPPPLPFSYLIKFSIINFHYTIHSSSILLNIIDSSTMEVGLRLLPQIISSKSNSNILIKSAVKKSNQTIPMDFCYLKTCNLCNKQLSPNKDIYMYRYWQILNSLEYFLGPNLYQIFRVSIVN